MHQKELAVFNADEKRFFCVKNCLSGGFTIMCSKTAFLLIIIFSLVFFSCAKKEALRLAAIEPYEGPVTIEILKKSIGFGNIRSVKAFVDVTISKQGKTEESLNGVLGYKAPGKMRINLFGPFGLTVTEILISGELLQLFVPPKNVLYEWSSPEVTLTGLMHGRFRYEMAEEGEMYVLLAYNTDEQNPDVTARYYFDRTYLLNRAICFYKDGSEVIRTEFYDFNGRVPERTRLSFSNSLLMDIALQEPEFDSDIPEAYFRTIEHGDKQIKSFQEAFKRFAPGP
jgi:hypothetical protein